MYLVKKKYADSIILGILSEFLYIFSFSECIALKGQNPLF